MNAEGVVCVVVKESAGHTRVITWQGNQDHEQRYQPFVFESVSRSQGVLTERCERAGNVRTV
jgi:hypothetical protein